MNSDNIYLLLFQWFESNALFGHFIEGVIRNNIMDAQALGPIEKPPNQIS